MGKNSKKIKAKLEIQNKANLKEGDVPVSDIIEILKKEILQEVRAIATGVRMSAFQMVELDKELQELEKQLIAPKIENEFPDFN